MVTWVFTRYFSEYSMSNLFIKHFLWLSGWQSVNFNDPDHGFVGDSNERRPINGVVVDDGDNRGKLLFKRVSLIFILL